MKRRRLKTPAPKQPSVAPTHARVATELPAHAEIAVGLRPNPYDPTERISVALSLKGDPLLGLHCRGQIADFEFAAGRQWQRYYEEAQVGTLRGIDTTLEPVDGGGSSLVFLSDVQRKAVGKLLRCRAILGETSNTIVVLVLGSNLSIQRAAIARGMVTEREIAYVGKRFREALGELARIFNFA